MKIQLTKILGTDLGYLPIGTELDVPEEMGQAMLTYYAKDVSKGFFVVTRDGRELSTHPNIEEEYGEQGPEEDDETESGEDE